MFCPFDGKPMTKVEDYPDTGTTTYFWSEQCPDGHKWECQHDAEMESSKLELLPAGVEEPEPEEEGECPNCHNGTLGLEEGRLVCRGECGTVFPPRDE